MNAADFKPKHFQWSVQGKVATITLDRPDKKNPLTFESYAELRDTFLALKKVEDRLSGIEERLTHIEEMCEKLLARTATKSPK